MADKEVIVPENFRYIIADFTNDLSITFPEYVYLWDKWRNPEIDEKEIEILFRYCMTVYPERFFDFLYENHDIFKPDETTDTMFLPDVDFKLLYNCQDVSEKTKKTIWKYLQLVLFTIVSAVKDKSDFGDAINIFDGIGEEELHEKLHETMSGISDFFTDMGINPDKTENTGDESQPQQDEGADFKPSFSFDKMDGMPNIEELHNNLKSMFDGKIGTLAKELAEEISKDLQDFIGEDANDVRSTKDVLKKLMKDPKKIVNMLKTVGDKLNQKMKSGDISQDELMREASDIMNKMKEMGGTDQFNEMLKNFAKGMGGFGKNAKVDTNAISRMSKQYQQQERMRSKLDAKRQANLHKTNVANNYVYREEGAEVQEKSSAKPILTEEELIAEIGDSVSQQNSSNQNKNNKKKNKKQKK